MSESTIARPVDVRARVLIYVGAVLAACLALAVVSILVNSAPAAPARVETVIPVVGAPELSAQARDAWYLEPQSGVAAPAVSAQVRDAWYLEPKTALPAPALSEQSRDAWYLEP